MITQSVIEAAFARAIGDTDVIESYDEQTLEASHKQFKNGCTLVELLLMAGRANGFRDVSHRNVRQLLEAAFVPRHAILAKGASTMDIDGVLSSVSNKLLTAGYMSVEQSWRKVASIGTVTDLKAINLYSIGGDYEFKEVGKSGEITHASSNEEKYSNQASTFARMHAITRAQILNDDLGALNNVRKLLGRGAALSFNKLFWKVFLTGLGTRFTAARKNFLSGASTALDVDSLSAALTAYRKLLDPDGNPLGIEPKLLIVPVSLEIQANRITKDGEIRIVGATAEKVVTTSNPMAGRFEVAASTYLDTPAIPGGSPDHWWLAADPMDLELINVVFLNGAQTPVIESSAGNFDELSIVQRGYGDWGCSNMNPLAAIYCAGK